MFESVRILGNNMFIDNVVVDALTGIDDPKPKTENDIVIYPNPSTGLVTIRINNEPLDGKVSIFNIQGKLVHETALRSGQQSVQLNLSSNPKGLYFISVVSDGMNMTEKVLLK
jgi:DNA-binding beta-propeller fold protein YncE